VISSVRELETTLSRVVLGSGERMTVEVSLSVLREVPVVCQKYGLSMIDGEDVKGGVRVTLERRFEN
jgi:hypothetical protein